MLSGPVSMCQYVVLMCTGMLIVCTCTCYATASAAGMSVAGCVATAAAAVGRVLKTEGCIPRAAEDNHQVLHIMWKCPSCSPDEGTLPNGRQRQVVVHQAACDRREVRE
jgi:hypothetical protein